MIFPGASVVKIPILQGNENHRLCHSRQTLLNERQGLWCLRDLDDRPIVKRSAQVAWRLEVDTGVCRRDISIMLCGI